MDGRKYLDALFGADDLGERDQHLARWLAQNFVIEHPNEVLKIVAAHGLQMNPSLWWSVAREIGVMKEKPLDEAMLKRWASILLASAPPNADQHALMWLAERCASQGCVELTLKVFMAMSEHRLRIKPSFEWPNDTGDKSHRQLDAECPLRADHWSLNEVWTKHLKPHHVRVSQPLLIGVVRRIEEMHGDLTREISTYRMTAANSATDEKTLAEKKQALLKTSAEAAKKIHAARDAVVEANNDVLRVIHLKVNYRNYVSDERRGGIQDAPWLTVSLAKIAKVHNQIATDNETLAKLDVTASAQLPLDRNEEGKLTLAMRQIYKSIEEHSQRARNVRFVIPLESSTNRMEFYDATARKKVEFSPCDADLRFSSA